MLHPFLKLLKISIKALFDLDFSDLLFLCSFDLFLVVFLRLAVLGLRIESCAVSGVPDEHVTTLYKQHYCCGV